MNKFFLSDTYLLKGATLGDIEAVEGVCEVREFEPGQTIVTEGDRSQDIMIVASGRVRVERKDGSVVDELRVGAMIGEVAFIDGQPRTASLVALNEARLFVVPAEPLRRILRERPALELVVMRNAAVALCQRLRGVTQELELLRVDE